MNSALHYFHSFFPIINLSDIKSVGSTKSQFHAGAGHINPVRSTLHTIGLVNQIQNAIDSNNKLIVVLGNISIIFHVVTRSLKTFTQSRNKDIDHKFIKIRFRWSRRIKRVLNKVHAANKTSSSNKVFTVPSDFAHRGAVGGKMIRSSLRVTGD